MPKKERTLPPGCGTGLNDEVLWHPHAEAFLNARRQRICPNCAEIHPVDGDGVFRCPACRCVEPSQLIARKAYHRVGFKAGRRSAKTHTGARAAKEEIVVPNALGWVMAPTYKILHDATMPALFKILPPEWVANWSPGHHELTLVNGHVVQFRSLDDPLSPVGQGPWWAWIDEAQKVKELAWDTFRPSLTDHVGNCYFTWTPGGFDWCYRRLWKPAWPQFAASYQPGFWMTKCHTVDNPFIQKYGLGDVEEARRTMPPDMFRQEYEADDVSFVGNVYDWEVIESQIIAADALASFIPEWPLIEPSRLALVGMGGGTTYPFAALLVAATPRGLVVVDEYYEQHRSTMTHYAGMLAQFGIRRQGGTFQWSADEQKKELHHEFAQHGVGVIPTEHYLMSGVQRAQTWLYAKQLFFSSSCARTLDQLRDYRWNDLTDDDGERKDTERDYRKDDELPKALHAAVLAYPELPTVPVVTEGRDLSQLDDKTRWEIERLMRIDAAEAEGMRLQPGQAGYPFGEDWLHS